MINIEDKRVFVEKKKNSQKVNKKQTVGAIILAVIIIVVIAFLVIVQPGKSADEKSLAETNKIIKQISKIMFLPEETPSVATVVNKDELLSQPFFANAEAGDKLLIYTVSQKAILYRPKSNKIVEVMPLIMDKVNTPEGSMQTGNMNSEAFAQ